jgi:hypothetical protein
MSLEHIHMGGRRTETFDGVNPRILNVLLNNLDIAYRFGYLKTLSLVLTSRNRKLSPESYRFPKHSKSFGEFATNQLY